MSMRGLPIAVSDSSVDALTERKTTMDTLAIAIDEELVKAHWPQELRIALSIVRNFGRGRGYEPVGIRRHPSA